MIAPGRQPALGHPSASLSLPFRRTVGGIELVDAFPYFGGFSETPVVHQVQCELSEIAQVPGLQMRDLAKDDFALLVVLLRFVNLLEPSPKEAVEEAKLPIHPLFFAKLRPNEAREPERLLMLPVEHKVVKVPQRPPP